MKQSHLVIVANTLPVRRVDRGGATAWETSPGGLVSALAPIAKDQGGAWVGWTGEVDRARKPFTHGGLLNVPVTVTAEQVARSAQNTDGSLGMPRDGDHFGIQTIWAES